MKQIAMKFFPIYIFLSFSAIIFSQQLSGKVTYVASMIPIPDKKIDSLLSTRKSKNKKMNDLVKNMFKNTPKPKWTTAWHRFYKYTYTKMGHGTGM